MSFRITHIKKYIRWLKNTNSKYKENCLISKEYAGICRRMDWAMLLNRSQEDIDEKADKKHQWILKYMIHQCPKTIEKYSHIQPPEDLHELQKETKVWSMWWQEKRMQTSCSECA